MDAVETAVAQTSALAGSARDIAAARPPCRRTGPAAWRRWTRTARCPPATCPIPCRCRKGRGRWRGAAGRGGQGPAGHLPDSIPMSQKGAADGVTLDAAGKVPVAHLPKLDYLPVIQRGAPDGVAPLDAQGRCRRPTCRRRRTPFRWRRKASPMASWRWPPTAGAGGAAASDRIDSHGLRGLGAEAGGIWAGWIPGDGQLVSRATFPDLAAAVADGVVRSCPRPSGWRIRSSVAPTRSAMGQPAFACRTTTASLQARLARPFSEAMAPCP